MLLTHPYQGCLSFREGRCSDPRGKTIKLNAPRGEGPRLLHIIESTPTWPHALFFLPTERKYLGEKIPTKTFSKAPPPPPDLHRCLRVYLQEEVVATSREKRCTAADEKAYLDQVQESLAVSPPVLAYVPDRWPDGRPKNVRGWKVGKVG